MSSSFSERRIDAGGASIRCLEQGRGDMVITLHGKSGTAPTPLEEMLAQKFRIIALEAAGFAATPQDGARLLERALATLGADKYALIADGSAAPTAVCQTAEAAAAPVTLVLCSPGGALAQSHLTGIRVPTLVLVGTKDDQAAVAAGQLCAELIPECYPMLVYDSGPAMAIERPAAVFEAVADFLERGGRFVLERKESPINP